MQEQFNSLSEILKYFSKLTDQTISILTNINNAMFTNNQTVKMTLTNSKGVAGDYYIPSFTYINNKLSEIDLNLNKIRNLGKRSNNLPLFSQEEVSEPKKIEKVIGPKEFYSKPNLFLENFLNPLLYIKVDVSDYVLPNTKQLVSRRLLLNFDDQEIESWFDDNFNNKNDLIYDDVIKLIEDKGIEYKIDDDILNLPPISLKYSGNFDIIQMYSDIYDNEKYSYTKKFKFSTLAYTNNETKTLENLKVGDILITQNGETDYEVLYIPDQTNNIVVLGLKSGFDIVKPSVDSLSIASLPIGLKHFEIPITYNENQIIFLKSVSPYFHTSSHDFGLGFGFKSKNLVIQTTDGIIDFNNYYLNKTFDFGKQFRHLEDNKKIPVMYGKTPNRPFLNETDFDVKIINQQRFTTKINEKVSQVLAQKQLLEEQKTEFNNKIIEISLLLENSDLSDEEANLLKEEQKKYIHDLSTTIEQLETNAKEVANNFNFFNEDIKPKYRIIGAFPIPEPIWDVTTGFQYIVQFNIRYRYLTSDERPMPAEKYKYLDINGNNVTITDDNWMYFNTNNRYRQINSDGSLTWSDEKDPINKIQIPINSNESVEFQIQSISEVGFPDNKFVSDWSPSLIIKFPEDKFSTDEYILTYKALLSEYFKNEYFKELTDLRKIVTILSKNLESLEEKVINMSAI